MRNSAKSKLGAVPEDVLNPAKYGLKTFEELAKVEPKEWTVKARRCCVEIFKSIF